MSSSNRDLLRRFFVLGYHDLRAQLTRRLGSAELANDVLHDTWLRIDRATPVGELRSPRRYLLQMAFHAALAHWRGDRDLVTLSDAKEAIGLVDEAPDPERAAAARSEAETLAGALAELTPRRREILLASRLDGVQLRDIAARLGISQRLVEIKLRHALAHCALRLDRKLIQRFGPKPLKDSEG
ncbi:sigma-70 family RNA polymerase sigma factor [Bradyrhizobium sp. 31Argb]|uniref:RNA polymerase sigma factor n=1 Tax=Bradyrhizobium sp. 31Argb TaxID=3141247 RepID=UPI003747D580